MAAKSSIPTDGSGESSPAVRTRSTPPDRKEMIGHLFRLKKGDLEKIKDPLIRKRIVEGDYVLAAAEGVAKTYRYHVVEFEGLGLKIHTQVLVFLAEAIGELVELDEATLKSLMQQVNPDALANGQPTSASEASTSESTRGWATP